MMSIALLIVSSRDAAAQVPPTFVIAWGSFGTGNDQFKTPVGVGVDGAGYVYVCDSNNHRVQKFTSQGVYVTQWSGSGDHRIEWPEGLAVDPDGNVYVAGSSRILKFSGDGTYLDQWGSFGHGNGELYVPRGVAFDPSGNVYVVDYGNHRIQKFTSDGTYLTQWNRGQVTDFTPDGIAIDPAGIVYVADHAGRVIRKFTGDGTELGSIGYGTFVFPVRVAADAHFIYAVDNGGSRVLMFRHDGTLVTSWGSAGSGPGQFLNPIGIAVDAAQNVFVCDTNNSRMQKFAFGTTAAEPLSWGRMKVLYR